MPAPTMPAISQVNEAVLSQAPAHREAFLAASPFRHAMIDSFFDEAFANRLLDEFPTFDRKLSINEAGREGGKSVNTKLAAISPAYQELYALIGSPEFLQLASELTGIPDLLMDPEMYGGGTHENLHGQELDPHVDFNYNQKQDLHRRLNLIVYLNKGWQQAWGGNIEIHSNPRDPYANRIRAYAPLFNRCVLFETNEHSWHAFDRINLPEDQRHLSRKSISIYLYTKDRPKDEVAPVHSTFYVQRFLPERIAAGYTLKQEDVDELAKLLLRRDTFLELYHRMELTKSAEIKDLTFYVDVLKDGTRAPVTGYALQPAAPTGLYPDQWAEARVVIPLRPVSPVKEVAVKGWRPLEAPAGTVTVTVGGNSAQAAVAGGFFEVKCAVASPSEEFQVEITIDAPSSGLPSSDDPRPLCYRLMELRLLHGTLASWAASLK